MARKLEELQRKDALSRAKSSKGTLSYPVDPYSQNAGEDQIKGCRLRIKGCRLRIKGFRLRGCLPKPRSRIIWSHTELAKPARIESTNLSARTPWLALRLGPPLFPQVIMLFSFNVIVCKFNVYHLIAHPARRGRALERVQVHLKTTKRQFFAIFESGKTVFRNSITCVLSVQF